MSSDICDAYIKNKYKQTKFFINRAREKCIKKYLPTTAQRTNWFTEKRNLGVDDTVIMTNDSTAEHMFVLSVIRKAFPDNKGPVLFFVVWQDINIFLDKKRK